MRPHARHNGVTAQGLREGAVRKSRLERISHCLLRRRSHAIQAALVTGGLAVATGMRLALGIDATVVPFATYFPIILLSALLLDVGWSIATAVMIVNNLLLDHPWHLDKGVVPPALLAFYVLSVAIIIATCAVLRAILRENAEQLAQIETFNAELQHRTKNILQIMRALVGRGARESDPHSYYEALGGRIDALAKANGLLRYGAVDSCELDELVRSALAPFDLSRCAISGRPERIGQGATTPLVMALHELATNATKYGALSATGGRVSLGWQVDGPDGVRLTWTERGGPPVQPPTRRGLGSRLLVPHGGLRDVVLDWNPAGLHCELLLCRAQNSGQSS